MNRLQNARRTKTLIDIPKSEISLGKNYFKFLQIHAYNKSSEL